MRADDKASVVELETLKTPFAASWKDHYLGLHVLYPAKSEPVTYSTSSAADVVQ
jgi:hypothetical protein